MGEGSWFGRTWRRFARVARPHQEYSWHDSAEVARGTLCVDMALARPDDGHTKRRSSPASRSSRWAVMPVFIVTSLTGRAKALYKKGYSACRRTQNPNSDMKLYDALRQGRPLELAGEPVAPVPAPGADWPLQLVRPVAPKGRAGAVPRSPHRVLKSTIRQGCAHLPHAQNIAVTTARLCSQAPQGGRLSPWAPTYNAFLSVGGHAAAVEPVSQTRIVCRME
jgi:hypothetical protein